MRSFLIRHLLPLAALALLPACSVVHSDPTPTFVPTGTYVPAMPARSAEAGLSIGSGGVDGRIGIAPLRWLVLTAQGTGYQNQNSKDYFRTGEIGMGFRWALGPRLTFGIYGGGGGGRGQSVGYRYVKSPWLFGKGWSYDSTDRQFRARYRTAYVMPALTYHDPAHRFEVSFAARFYRIGYYALWYHERVRRGGFNSLDSTTTLTGYSQRDVWISEEPQPRTQLTIQMNVEILPNLRIQLLAGVDFTNRPTTHYRAEVIPIVGSFGLSYRIGAGAPTP